MLLLHQTGSVRVGEVVRYSLTYTPSLDRILPPPTQLHVKVKNTSAIPLRAAYLHGPYTLYASCAPSTFLPNEKHYNREEEGEPDYEPQLKAGGSWLSKLTVPEAVRQDAIGGQIQDGDRKSFTWIIEIASQVLFSTTAAVHYELLVGRDEQSLNLGFTGVASNAGVPARLEDHQRDRHRNKAHTKGVFTKAVAVTVDDTDYLWNQPPFPGMEGTSMASKGPTNEREREATKSTGPRKRRKKVHLVIITHGLHSNLGADMLYMKESIDAAARQARIDARLAKEKRKRHRESLERQDVINRNNFGRDEVDDRTKSLPDINVPPQLTDPQDEHSDADDDEDQQEQVIVRGFNGNAVRTEKGIQYLGKRMAKYVLSMTYPDQPYLPVKSTITQSIVRTFTDQPSPTHADGRHPTHKGSSIVEDEKHRNHNLPYKITQISFIGHSLGGLIQTYAIAYIQKHSPGFFDKIEPVNFIALASPFLGLSNENPMYVKFALDFGLVGRTGQDLGLTWRAPTVAKGGWVAMVSGFGGSEKDQQPDPGTKPLLRILPTGPAHVALKRFRNRSVYSNVVNDGIVPLRTSCLLFLDWRGLGRVEKARRENGLVGTMIHWGLAEMTGQNASAPKRGLFDDLFGDSDVEGKAQVKSSDPASRVPQAETSQALDEEIESHTDSRQVDSSMDKDRMTTGPDSNNSGIWSTLTSFFRPHAGHQKKAGTRSAKQQKAFSRGQIMKPDAEDAVEETDQTKHPKPPLSRDSSSEGPRKYLVRGSSLYTNASNENVMSDAPPRTSVFESAGDLINPPLPPKEFILDPASRPRTIFHDRVYHPDDIPPPPTKRQRTILSRPHSREGVPSLSSLEQESSPKIGSSESGSMRIEERIARAYHKDMSWRKVLVRLEPDAHNNIIVRRMFANAYGWPVIKHLCDTHFAYTDAALTRDEEEHNEERAKQTNEKPAEHGEEVTDQTKQPDETGPAPDHPERARTISPDEPLEIQPSTSPDTSRPSRAQYLSVSKPGRTPSERREASDSVPDLTAMMDATGAPTTSFSGAHAGAAHASLSSISRRDSGRWSDRYFHSSDDGSDEEDEGLSTAFQQAYDRGHGFKPTPASSRAPTRDGPRASTELPVRTGRARGKSILADDEGEGAQFVAEPDDLGAGAGSPTAVGLSDARDLREQGTGRMEHVLSAGSGRSGSAEQQ